MDTYDYLLNLKFEVEDEVDTNKYLIKSVKPLSNADVYELFCNTDKTLDEDAYTGYADYGLNIDTFVRGLNRVPYIAVIRLEGSQKLADDLNGYFEATVYAKISVDIEGYTAPVKPIIPTTNYQLLTRFVKKFRPSKKGFLSDDEVDAIKGALFIDDRGVLDLRNLRDMTVMVLGKMADRNRDNAFNDMDIMSGITAVIDDRIYALGGEV